jgi:hypothetical protein
LTRDYLFVAQIFVFRIAQNFHKTVQFLFTLLTFKAWLGGFALMGVLGYNIGKELDPRHPICGAAAGIATGKIR